MEIGDLLADAAGGSGTFGGPNTYNPLKIEETSELHSMQVEQDEEESANDIGHRYTGGKRPFAMTSGSTTPTSNKRAGGNKGKKKATAQSTPKEPIATASIPRNLSTHEKRRLENEAYAAVLTAFRAQGELTWKKDEILVELRTILKVSEDKHRSELKRLEDIMSPGRRRREEVSEGEDANDMPNEEETEEAKNKKHPKVPTRESALSAVPAPFTDSQTAHFVNVPVVAQKKDDGKKKEKKKDAKVETTGIEAPPDILAAQQSGDPAQLKEALERRKAYLLSLQSQQQQQLQQPR